MPKMSSRGKPKQSELPFDLAALIREGAAHLRDGP
jgi:hypothetical protein